MRCKSLNVLFAMLLPMLASCSVTNICTRHSDCTYGEMCGERGLCALAPDANIDEAADGGVDPGSTDAAQDFDATPTDASVFDAAYGDATVVDGSFADSAFVDVSPLPDATPVPDAEPPYVPFTPLGDQHDSPDDWGGEDTVQEPHVENASTHIGM